MKSNYLKSSDFEKSEAVESIYNPDILKGSKTGHKYLRKEGGKYIYHDSYQKGIAGQAHHHANFAFYHEGESSKFRSLTNNALSDSLNAQHNENIDKYFELSKEHANKYAFHKGEALKNRALINTDKVEREKYNTIANEHDLEGITPEKYVKAYEEHVSKKAENERQENLKSVRKNDFKKHLQHMSDVDFVPNDRKDYEKVTDKKLRAELLSALDSRNKNFHELAKAKLKSYE